MKHNEILHEQSTVTKNKRKLYVSQNCISFVTKIYIVTVIIRAFRVRAGFWFMFSTPLYSSQGLAFLNRLHVNDIKQCMNRPT